MREPEERHEVGRRRMKIKRMRFIKVQSAATAVETCFGVDAHVNMNNNNAENSNNKRRLKELVSCESGNKKPSGKLNDIERTNCSDKENDQMPAAAVLEKGGVAMKHVASTQMEGALTETSKSVMSYGMISIIGRRRAMEDAVVVATGQIDSYDFFGVYDGHGGSRVAEACRERMHLLVADEVRRWKECGVGKLDWVKVMAASFAGMDREVGEASAASVVEETDTKTLGSTALAVIVGKDEVVVANCGDSRVVLRRGGVALPLSRDHKPDRPDERERVEAAGGEVVNWNGSRVLGVLATSRSIGDRYLKPYVISEPEVTVTEKTESDDFLVIASDGLWDVVSNELACEVAKRCLEGQIRGRFSEAGREGAAEAATMLAELAISRGSKDNISIIVVKLKN